MQKIPVLLLSADAVLRKQWLSIKNEEYQFDQAQTVEQGVSWAREHNQSLVMVDASMVKLNEPNWQQLFTNPDAHILVGSLSPSDPEGQKMIVAGAKAYFHAYSPVSVLNTILQQVHGGNIWVGQSLLSRLLSKVSTQLDASPLAPVAESWQENLTPREIEVAQRAALGHSNALIAEGLGITERTVRAHLSAVFEKLDVADRLMLALKVHGIG